MSSSGGATTGSTTGGPTTGGPTTGGGGSGGSPGAGSPGCGSETPLESGTFTIDVDGTERTYILDVPASYDTNHQYRLVFTWHPLGGSATQVVNGGYYGLKAISDETAIFVSPDGLVGMAAGIEGQGWYNTGGGDMAFLRAMLDHFNQNACIDQGRIFSTGFSFGGMMSNAIGCELADVFRAIAPMSGNLQGSGCNDTSDHPVAYLGIHGDNDTFVTTESGRVARDLFVARNHCQTETEPSDPSICVAYTGCDEGYPVRWCEFSGGHTPWSDAAQPVWDFFSQF
jgi:poly(3-hydroxybutyrate) depolymerase